MQSPAVFVGLPIAGLLVQNISYAGAFSLAGAALILAGIVTALVPILMLFVASKLSFKDQNSIFYLGKRKPALHRRLYQKFSALLLLF